MVPKIGKILFATDLTKNSAYAFAYAIQLARDTKARIVVLHAIEPLPAVVRFHGTLEEEALYYEKAKEDAKTKIGRVALSPGWRALNAAGTPITELVEKVICSVGHPMDEILSTADAEQCDLILLGSHGKGLLRSTFLGSVSRSVLDRSRRPVFVVPLPEEHVSVDWNEG